MEHQYCMKCGEFGKHQCSRGISNNRFRRLHDIMLKKIYSDGYLGVCCELKDLHFFVVQTDIAETIYMNVKSECMGCITHMPFVLTGNLTDDSMDMKSISKSSIAALKMANMEGRDIYRRTTGHTQYKYHTIWRKCEKYSIWE